MKRLLPAFLLVLCSGFYAVAQDQPNTSCAQSLRLAQATYESGRLHDVPNYLSNCTNSTVTQERVTAYKLLCLTYIYLEEPAKADDAMLKILQTFHEFKPSNADPAEFVALWKTFRRDPIYRFGGKLGANASQPNVKESVEANQGKSKYAYKIGIQIYATAEIPLTEKLTFNPSLGYIQRSFEFSNNYTDGDTTFLTIVKETQQWLSLPLVVQYKVTRLKFEPYVSLGIQTDYLLGTNSLGSRDRTGYQFIQEEKFDFKSLRNKLNLSVIAGVGGRVKLGGGYIVGEANFAYGINPLSSKASAYENTEVAFKFGYADNLFSLNGLSLSVGYVYNIYNPKKIRK